MTAGAAQLSFMQLFISLVRVSVFGARGTFTRAVLPSLDSLPEDSSTAVTAK